MILPSWKALYAKLAEDSPLAAAAGFKELLKTDDNINKCKTDLATTPHCAILAVFPGNTIKILHHFKHDVKNAVLKEGTDALWALLGPGATAAPVSILDDAFNSLEVSTPTFEKINEATNLDELKSLTPATATRSHPSFAGKKCIAIPPLLTKVLMDADSEDPFVLLKSCCKALTNSDSYDAAMVNNDGTDADDATDSFFYVVQFLYHVATKAVARACSLEILTHSRTLEWAPSVHAECKINLSSNSSDYGLSDDAALRVGTSIARLQQELKDHKEAMRAKQDIADKKASKAGTEKLSPFSLRMILNASEPIKEDETDDDGNPIMARRTPVESYATLLNCATVGLVREHLEYHLNVKKQCNIVIPLSLCTAIFVGHLRWQSLEFPEAFSLLACYHLAPSAVSANGTDAMIMHLKTTEGTGLTESDVSKATKVELLPPDSIDVLAKQLGVFMCICGAVLGDYAPVTLELEEWADHI